MMNVTAASGHQPAQAAAVAVSRVRGQLRAVQKSVDTP